MLTETYSMDEGWRDLANMFGIEAVDRVWAAQVFGELHGGGCLAGDRSPEEETWLPMTAMERWLEFAAPDDY